MAHLIFSATEKTGRVYTGQAGWFYIIPNKGNNYACILYYYYENNIITDPLNNWTEQEILRAYSKLHIYRTERGFQPKSNGPENEA